MELPGEQAMNRQRIGAIAETLLQYCEDNGEGRAVRKLSISVDPEGRIAVSSQHDARPDHCEWNVARRWMTPEAIAVGEIPFEAGNCQVIVAGWRAGGGRGIRLWG
jgi:hypothetical protein